MTISTLGPIKMPENVTAASAKLKEITGEAAKEAPKASTALPFNAPLSKDAFESKVKEIGDKAMKETIAESGKTSAQKTLEQAAKSKKGIKETIKGVFSNIVNAAKTHKVAAAAIGIATVAAAAVGITAAVKHSQKSHQA